MQPDPQNACAHQFFRSRNFSRTRRPHIPPSRTGLPSSPGGGVRGGVIGLARPLDECRDPSSMSDISSELFSSHESRCESSRLFATDCERKPPTERADDGGNELRFGDIGMGCDVVEVTGVMSSMDEERVEVPLDEDGLRFSRAPGDLFHKLRVNEGSAFAFDGEPMFAFVLASQLAINDARALSRIRL
jgi:hypothetical protein